MTSISPEKLAEIRARVEASPPLGHGDFISHARTDIPTLLTEVERLSGERNNAIARATNRSKKLIWLRDHLINISDGVEDEGDRRYFGSTNDADAFKEVVAYLDAFKWERIIHDADNDDVIENCRLANERALAAESSVSRLTERAETAERERDETRQTARESEDAYQSLTERLQDLCDRHGCPAGMHRLSWLDMQLKTPAELEALLTSSSGIPDAWLVIGAQAHRSFDSKLKADECAGKWGRVLPLYRGDAIPDHDFTGNAPGVVGADNCQICGLWYGEHSRAASSLSTTLRRAVERMNAMTPEERKAHFKAQRDSWVRAEMALGEWERSMTVVSARRSSEGGA